MWSIGNEIPDRHKPEVVEQAKMLAAKPVSIESFTGNVRKAWHGRCMVIVRSATERGNIVLRAKSPGFDTAEIQIKSE